MSTTSVGNPRCRRIFLITLAWVITAISRRLPPQGHVRTSTPKLSRSASLQVSFRDFSASAASTGQGAGREYLERQAGYGLGDRGSATRRAVTSEHYLGSPLGARPKSPEVTEEWLNGKGAGPRMLGAVSRLRLRRPRQQRQELRRLRRGQQTAGSQGPSAQQTPYEFGANLLGTGVRRHDGWGETELDACKNLESPSSPCRLTLAAQRIGCWSSAPRRRQPGSQNEIYTANGYLAAERPRAPLWRLCR